MNDQSQMMSQPPASMMSQPPPSMMSQPPPLMMSQPPLPMMSQPPPQVMKSVPSQIMSQTQLIGQPQPVNHPVRGQIALSQAMNLAQAQIMLNRPLMQSRGFNPNMRKKYQNHSSTTKPNSFGPIPMQPKMSRSNWKGKKVATDKRPMMDSMRRMDNQLNSGINIGPGSTGGYKPPALNELQSQNRLKTKKFYPKKKFNNRYVPYAPRNTSSYIIRAKKAGGIAELVSPCPVTPAVLPTPIFSPSREVLGDMAKEEWGVDGYGSMKGLIRLRSPGHELEPHDDDDDEEGASSESDVEEHVEVERRLDHDLSRFEMIYPNYGGFEYNNVLENRVDDQDTHIAQLEEENLTLKERLFLMERELGDMRRRLQFLERRVVEDVNEEVVENGSENESEREDSDAHASTDTKRENHEGRDVCMEEATRDVTIQKEVDDEIKAEETSKKFADAYMVPGEVNKLMGGNVEARTLGGNQLAPRKQDGEFMREGAGTARQVRDKIFSGKQVDEHRGNEAVSEEQNDDSSTRKDAHNSGGNETDAVEFSA